MKAVMLSSSARLSARSVVGAAVQCPLRPKATSAIWVSGHNDTAQRSGPIGEEIVSNMASFQDSEDSALREKQGTYSKGGTFFVFASDYPLGATSCQVIENKCS